MKSFPELLSSIHSLNYGNFFLSIEITEKLLTRLVAILSENSIPT